MKSKYLIFFWRSTSTRLRHDYNATFSSPFHTHLEAFQKKADAPIFSVAKNHFHNLLRNTLNDICQQTLSLNLPSNVLSDWISVNENINFYDLLNNDFMIYSTTFSNVSFKNQNYHFNSLYFLLLIYELIKTLFYRRICEKFSRDFRNVYKIFKEKKNLRKI